ncbi:hypothetical protein SK128_003830, partial [Halocaridina rubra]
SRAWIWSSLCVGIFYLSSVIYIWMRYNDIFKTELDIPDLQNSARLLQHNDVMRKRINDGHFHNKNGKRAKAEEEKGGEVGGGGQKRGKGEEEEFNIGPPLQYRNYTVAVPGWNKASSSSSSSPSFSSTTTHSSSSVAPLFRPLPPPSLSSPLDRNYHRHKRTSHQQENEVKNKRDIDKNGSENELENYSHFHYAPNLKHIPDDEIRDEKQIKYVSESDLNEYESRQKYNSHILSSFEAVKTAEEKLEENEAEGEEKESENEEDKESDHISIDVIVSKWNISIYVDGIKVLHEQMQYSDFKYSRKGGLYLVVLHQSTGLAMHSSKHRSFEDSGDQDLLETLKNIQAGRIVVLGAMKI